jgi:hypothetical protein
VYIGGLLVFETQNAAAGKPGITTVPLQSLALGLLVFIAASKSLSIPLPKGSLSLSTNQAKSFIGLVFNLVASISIAVGAGRISNRLSYALLLLILGCYAVMDIRHCFYEVSTGTLLKLTIFEYEAYAVLKAAFTLIFGFIVAYYGMSEDDRKRGFVYWVLHFWALA